VIAAVEQLHARGRRALLAGEEDYDRPPTAGSRRWGVSVILRPDEDAARRLATVTGEVSALAGPGHWPTGRLGSGHLTVRGLEHRRDPVPSQDPVLGRYCAAVARVAGRTAPLHFALTGLLLVPGAVLALAEPLGPAPDGLRAGLAAELGADGQFEDDGYRQGLWWSTLLHLAGPLVDAANLVDWVQTRRSLDVGELRARSIDLVRYDYDGTCTSPVTLASTPLAA
jgi:hypothetical protein